MSIKKLYKGNLLDYSSVEKDYYCHEKQIIDPLATFVAKYNGPDDFSIETFYPAKIDIPNLLDCSLLFPQIPTHFKSEFLVSRLNDDYFVFSMFKVKASIHNPKKLKIRSIGIITSELAFSTNLTKFLSHKIDQINVTEALSLIGDIHDDIVDHSYLNELHSKIDVEWIIKMPAISLIFILRTLMAGKVVAIVSDHNMGPLCASFAQFCCIFGFDFLGFVSNLNDFSGLFSGLIVTTDFIEHDEIDLYLTHSDGAWSHYFNNKTTQHTVHVSIFSGIKSQVSSSQKVSPERTIDCLLAYKRSICSRIHIAATSNKAIKLWYDKKFYRAVAANLNEKIVVKKYLF